jgi:hypothetical protein
MHRSDGRDVVATRTGSLALPVLMSGLMIDTAWNNDVE